MIDSDAASFKFLVAVESLSYCDNCGASSDNTEDRLTNSKLLSRLLFYKKRA